MQRKLLDRNMTNSWKFANRWARRKRAEAKKCLKILQKEFADVYVHDFRRMKALKNYQIDKMIIETKETYANDDSFDPDETLSAVVDKRKFLLIQVLRDQRHFLDSEVIRKKSM